MPILVAILMAGAALAETFEYKRVGNLAIQADVYRGEGASPRPVVMFIHGGALIMGSRKYPPAKFEPYQKAGFTVVSIDYRLAPETKLPELWKDVEDAYRWIRKDGPRLFGADPSRIAVTGQSAGGFLTLLAGARFRPAPKALVAWYGYGDLAGDWYAKPDDFYRKQPLVPKDEALASVGTAPVSDPPTPNKRGRFYLYTRQQGLWPLLVAGFDPSAQRKQLDRYCPAQTAGKSYPPTMLLHGDADTDVPVDQSRQMADVLQRLGVEHELVILPGHPHGFDRAMDKPEVKAAFDRAMKFLAARLR